MPSRKLPSLCFTRLRKLDCTLLFGEPLPGWRNLWLLPSVLGVFCLISPQSFVSGSHLFPAGSHTASFLCHASSQLIELAIFFFSFHPATCRSLSALAASYISCLYGFFNVLFSLSLENICSLFLHTLIPSLFSDPLWRSNMKVLVGWGKVSTILRGS